MHQAQSLLHPRSARRGRTGRGTAAAPWVAVSGGKGGVGKTMIAVNLAILAARAGYRTLLADFDPGLANVDVSLRLSPRFTLEDLARDACSTAEALVQGPAGISVLAGCSGSTALLDEPDLLASAHAAVERCARDHGHDLVICDTGAGIGSTVLDTAARSSLVLAVTTPDPAAATDTYALIKLLQRTGQGVLPRLAVNRVTGRGQAMDVAARLSTVCRKFLGADLSLAGWLRDDTEIARASLQQRPLAARPGSRGAAALEELRALAATVLSTVPARRSAARAVSEVG